MKLDYKQALKQEILRDSRNEYSEAELNKMDEIELKRVLDNIVMTVRRD